MGKKGPIGKPTHIRELENNASRRPLNDREPEVPHVTYIDPPAYFFGEHLSIWYEVNAELAILRGLSPVDRKMLELYVDTLVKLRFVGRQLKDLGTFTMTLKGADGQSRSAKTVPQFQQYMTLSQQALRLAQNFGMTPAARARIVFFGKGEDGESRDKDPFE